MVSANSTVSGARNERKEDAARGPGRALVALLKGVSGGNGGQETRGQHDDILFPLEAPQVDRPGQGSMEQALLQDAERLSRRLALPPIDIDDVLASEPAGLAAQSYLLSLSRTTG